MYLLLRHFALSMIFAFLITYPALSQNSKGSGTEDSSKKEIKAPRDNSYKLINRDQIENLPVDNPLAIPAYIYPQMNNDNAPNYSMARKTRTIIGGADINSPFTGNFGFSGMEYYPVASREAVEEIRIYDNYIPLEYGETMDGAVLYNLRKGNPNRYEGYIKYNTEVPLLFGKYPLSGAMNSDVFVVGSPGNFQVVRLDKDIMRRSGPTVNSTGERSWNAGLGGPLPLLNNSTFFLSTGYFRMDNEPGLEVYDPQNNNLGKLPNQGRWVKNITGSISLDLGKGIKLNIEGIAGLTSLETSSWYWLYATDIGTTGIGKGVQERIAKQNVVNQSITDFSAKLNHAFSDKISYELKLSRNTINQESGRRADFNGPSFWSGFKLIRPVDNMYFQGDSIINTRDGIVDQYANASKIMQIDDGLLMDVPQVNPLTGFIEGASYSTTDNAYGMPYLFSQHGNTSGFEFLKSTSTEGNLKVWLNDIIPMSNLLIGFDFRTYTLKRNLNNNPWNGLSDFDVFTDEGERIIYMGDSTFWTEPATPLFISSYCEDRFVYGNLNITGGLRFDYFNAKRSYVPNDDYILFRRYREAGSQTYFSPRVNISYSFSEDISASVSYNRLASMPDFYSIYQDLKPWITGDAIRGNPDIQPIISDQINCNIFTRLGNTLDLSFDLYYRAYIRQLILFYWPAVPDPFFYYESSDIPKQRFYGANFGLNVNFLKYLHYRLNTSLVYTNNIVSGEIGPYNQAMSYYPRELDNKYVYAMVGSSSSLYIQTMDNEGLRIFGFPLFENIYLGFTGYYRTGLPYSRVDQNGFYIGDFNSARQPDYSRLDARLSKAFRLSEIIGDIGGNTQIEFSIDVLNLSNRTDAVWVYPESGNADYTGFSERTALDFGNINYYKTATLNNPDSYSPDQYDIYGKRLYNAAADLDNNGITTPDERFHNILKYYEDFLRLSKNYQLPRMVYFSVQFKF